jgi:hypothetical protein
LPTDGATRFRYTFSIVNDGPVAVTIRGAGSPLDGPHSEVFTRPVRVIPDERTRGRTATSCTSRGTRSSSSPEKEAGIEMQVTFRPTICLDGTTTLGIWPEPIRFSVFGIPRETTFESDLEIHITGTKPCPSG